MNEGGGRNRKWVGMWEHRNGKTSSQIPHNQSLLKCIRLSERELLRTALLSLLVWERCWRIFIASVWIAWDLGGSAKRAEVTT